MSLKNYSHEEITGMAMIELANVILEDANKELDFRDIFAKLAELKGYTEEQKQDFLAQFYTDLNIDGRFMTLGSDKWGLKHWYPADQIDEEITVEPKKKKKSKKKQKKTEKEEVKDTEAEEIDVVDEDIKEVTNDLDAGFDDYDEAALEDEELDDEAFAEGDAEDEEEDEEDENEEESKK